jgi:hypothetical protein
MAWYRDSFTILQKLIINGNLSLLPMDVSEVILNSVPPQKNNGVRISAVLLFL